MSVLFRTRTRTGGRGETGLGRTDMNQIIYIIGLIVVIGIILSFLGVV